MNECKHIVHSSKIHVVCNRATKDMAYDVIFAVAQPDTHTHTGAAAALAQQHAARPYIIW